MGERGNRVGGGTVPSDPLDRSTVVDVTGQGCHQE